jgi:DNA-directed RNA polymerase specialized sigma24 family protein
MTSPLARHYGILFKSGCNLVVHKIGTTITAQAEARREFEAMPQIANVRLAGNTTSRDRESFAFFYAHGIAVKEIAVKFGVSQVTVGKHLNRKFPRQ